MSINYEDELFKTTMKEVDDRIRIRRGTGNDFSDNDSENFSSEKTEVKRSSEASSPFSTGRHSDREKLNCTIDIAEDAMTAYLMLYGKSDGDYTYEEILQYLNENGVIYGIREKTIKKMIEERQYYEEIIIARGTAAAKGCSRRCLSSFSFPWGRLGEAYASNHRKCPGHSAEDPGGYGDPSHHGPGERSHVQHHPV